MDFRKIQWIFIVAFVAIDIFLFVSWQKSDSTVTESAQHTGNDASTIIHEMRDDGITFSSPSTKEAEGYYVSTKPGLEKLRAGATNLSYQDVRFNSTELTSYLHQTLTVTKGSAQVALNRFIKNPTNVVAGDEYVYSPELSKVSENEVVYVQKLPSGTIMAPSGQLRFRVGAKEQVLSYTQSYVVQAKTLREKTTTISQQKALIWLYQYNELANNTKVVWSKLAYSRLLKVTNNNVYVPTWFVALKSKSTGNVVIKRVNAFTGAVMKSADSTTEVTDSGASSESSASTGGTTTTNQAVTTTGN
ncbi:two-component system regulatory protein YycI [Furfurilactobacillus sp. WILCCON 0119]